MSKFPTALLLACFVGAVVGEPASPIQKVVKLVTEMKAQTEKEAEEDMRAYDKYKCWCVTTEAKKTDDIKAAETLLEELSGVIQEGAATEGELKTEIAGLTEDIAADTDALSQATSLRAEENKDFTAEQADLKETLALLSEAMGVLSKVQLLQKPKEKQAALVQVHALVQRIQVSPKFHSVMQKDLFAMLGAFDDMGGQKTKTSGAFLGETSGSLPWIKSEETKALESNPNAEEGAAAGANSYNARSGGILGLLKQMGDESAKSLASAQKEELSALVGFNKLKAAKLKEIQAGSDQKNQKELDLANLKDKVAKAKEETEATMSSLSADQVFLMEATKNCKVEDEEYAKRLAVRSDEIKALGEVMGILTGDEARSLFDKTISFLQVGTVKNELSSAERAAAQEKATTLAMKKIVAVARKNKNWALASLAVHVKLDAFTKVKAAMDKMLAELKEQQSTEFSKRDSCNTQLDETEDKIKVRTQTKADLDSKHKDLTNTLANLANENARLTSEVAEMEVALKEAGEQRKDGNALYQTTMSDQRATIAILNMALARLKEFYDTKSASLVEVHAHNEPPPPKPQGYEKSASSGGILQLLSKIIADAESTESEIKMGEQRAQEEYAAFVSSSTASIQADRQAIEEAEKQAASAGSDKSDTEEGQLANDAETTKLGEFLSAVHLDCDYLLKYFDVRQEARAEEMDAINEAKAILSGADFA